MTIHNIHTYIQDSDETNHVWQLTSPMFSRVTSLRCRPDRRMPYRSGCSAANYNQQWEHNYQQPQCNQSINQSISIYCLVWHQ